MENKTSNETKTANDAKPIVMGSTFCRVFKL